jgi:hypothetical protein
MHTKQISTVQNLALHHDGRDGSVGRVSDPLCSKAGQRPALRQVAATTRKKGRALAAIIAFPATLLLAGCGGMAGIPGMSDMIMARNGVGAASGHASGGEINQMPDVNAMMAKSQLMQDLMNNPDLPTWYDQRQKLSMAMGDRVFDKSFDPVFDGMIVALATLGARVNNMDRTSGYITAYLPDLGPDATQKLAKEELAEYAAAKGYPASVLEKQGAFDIDPEMGRSMMSRMGGSGLTLTMVRHSTEQTKVKLRFDNVFFPKTVQELYRVAWTAVDKQMFLDRSLDH